MIHEQAPESCPLTFVYTYVMGKIFYSMLDSGSQITVFNESKWDKEKINIDLREIGNGKVKSTTG